MAKDGKKKVTHAQRTGRRGEHLVADLVLDMGFIWHGSDPLEAGLDGFIELADIDGTLVSQYIACQSKAVIDGFEDDDGETFAFTADATDLDYWLAMSGAVILVLSNPATREAYYVSLKDYFAQVKRRAKRKVVFNKKSDGLAGKAHELLDLARRESERGELPANALLLGPLAVLRLSDELDKAQQATQLARDKPTKARWRKAAQLWNDIAQATLAKSGERRLAWPALEERADALREAGDNAAAAEARLDLAADKISLDEPTAWMHIAGLEWLIDVTTLGFRYKLVSAQANWFEEASGALDELRALHQEATGAADKRASGGLLVEVLSLLGEYAEAYEVAGKLRKTKVTVGDRLSLELDWLDAAGELGHDVAKEWQALFEDKTVKRLPTVRARVLQRHGSFLSRRGDADGANESFNEAAMIWRGVPHADDQVVECLNSGLAASALNGARRIPLPFGAGAAAALARGGAQVPAVRGELLTNRGLSYLLEERYPDALKHLMAALALAHREGNLAAARTARLQLARAFAAADEPIEATRFFIQAGSPKPAQALVKAAGLVLADLGLVIRLKDAPAYEIEASLAVVEALALPLTEDEAKAVAADVLREAKPRSRVISPDPATAARRLLAKIAPSFPNKQAKQAVATLRDEIEVNGFLAPQATTALVKLNERGVADSTEFFLERLLAGEDLPVTIAGHLRDADEKTKDRVADAALAGNHEALVEAARAGLPDLRHDLIPALNQAVESAVAVDAESDEPIEELTVTSFGINFVGLGEMGCYVSPELRAKLVTHLLNVIVSAEYDDMSKVSALWAVAELASAVDNDEWAKLLNVAYALARGEFPPSAPAEVLSHKNPKRARSRFSHSVSEEYLRGVALFAISHLVKRVGADDRLEPTVTDALLSDDPQLLNFALFVAREHGVVVDTERLADLREHKDAVVRESAAKL